MFADKKFLEQFLDTLFDAVYFVDTERTILHWNKAAEILTGYKKDEIISHKCMDNILVHIDKNGNSLCTGNCPLLSAIKEDSVKESEIFLHHKEGHRIPASVRIIPLKNDSGEVTGAVEIFIPSDSRIQLSLKIEELTKLSMIDSLTGVANRRYGEKIIHDKIDEVNRFNWQTGLLFIDIDNFKSFNDTYSHSVGDKMIKIVANTIRESIRSFDNIARWGGEEFIVILNNVSLEQLLEKAELLRKLVSESFFYEKNIKLFSTISCGATLITAKDTVLSAVERADKLMYQSKKTGKNKVTVG